MTAKEMCEYIAKWLNESGKGPVTAEQIWNASPTGELWHVWELYAGAYAARTGELPDFAKRWMESFDAVMAQDFSGNTTGDVGVSEN